MSKEKGSPEITKKMHELQEQLHGMAYVGGRAVDALELINKSSFPAADAAKVAQCQKWLENVGRDVARQAKAVEAQIADLQTPATTTTGPMEVIPADKEQENAGDPLPIPEAADTLK